MGDHDLQLGAEALLGLRDRAQQEADKENSTLDCQHTDHEARGSAFPPAARASAGRPPFGVLFVLNSLLSFGASEEVSPPRPARCYRLCPCTSDACDKYIYGENCKGVKCGAGAGRCCCFAGHRVPQDDTEARVWYETLQPGLEVTEEGLEVFKKSRIHTCHFHEHDKFWKMVPGGGFRLQLKVGFKVPCFVPPISASAAQARAKITRKPLNSHDGTSKMVNMDYTQRQLKKVEKNLVHVFAEKEAEKARADAAEQRAAELERQLAETKLRGMGESAVRGGIGTVCASPRGDDGAVSHSTADAGKRKRKEQPPPAAISEERIAKDKKIGGMFSSLFGIPDLFRTKTLFGWLNRRGDADAVMCQSRISDDQCKRVRMSADGEKGRHPRLNRRIVSTFNRFLFVLFVLRTGMCLGAAAVLFGMGDSDGGAIFEQWIYFLVKRLSKGQFFITREQCFANSPQIYEKIYGKKIRGILDPTEVEIQKPSDLNLARACWSNYKQRYTVKILFVLSPCGKIVFVSEAFPGRITDSDLVRLSGFLDLVEDGDVYAADKGVTINPLLIPLGARIIYPPFKKKGQATFSADSAAESHAQAKVRVHVERAIRKIKVYKYMSQKQPLHTLHYYSQAVWVIVCLVNMFGSPVGPANIEEIVRAQKATDSNLHIQVKSLTECFSGAALDAQGCSYVNADHVTEQDRDAAKQPSSHFGDDDGMVLCGDFECDDV